MYGALCRNKNTQGPSDNSNNNAVGQMRPPTSELAYVRWARKSVISYNANVF